MKDPHAILPDGTHAIASFGIDEERNAAVAYAVFSGAHTAPRGPVPPTTGRQTHSDDVRHISFNDDGKIRQITKIWNDGAALAKLGFASPTARAKTR